jgi:transketolase
VRQAFIEALVEMAEADERIVLLTGDLGYMALDAFRGRFPERFLNIGVAEQNMIGIATGLAEAGLLPFAYSLATFASLRALEFIRNGPVAHRLPVRIVGMGMGFEYGHAGPTHHAVEDIGVLRTLPGLAIVIPADPSQAATAMRRTCHLPGPIYYSLGKDDRLTISGLDGRFGLGEVQEIRKGGDLAILSMGSITFEAVAAADELAGLGIQATVAVVSNFHPDPDEKVAELLREMRHVLTVEAQTISGGLASFVASVIASQGLECRLWALAVQASPDGTSGAQQDRWRKHGLDRHRIVETARRALGVSGC